MHIVLFANGVVGHIEDDENLHQLRRLKINDTERDPSSSAVDYLANTWNQDEQQ